jgi:PAS domain S-box-containing protein
MDVVADETRTLRRTMRDLVALSALPAVWAGYRPLAVAEGLADVLLATLRLDLVYIRLPGQAAGQGIEVARTAAGPTPADQARDIGRALAPWLDGAGTDAVPALPNPAGPGTVRAVAVPVGCGRPNGVLVATSRQPAFPSEEERLLLSVAANQAAAVLQCERDEEALRESEERYRTVIAAMQEGVVLLGADGRIRACNASAERILGLSAEEIMGRTTLDPRWQAIHEDGSAFPGETHPVMVTLRTGRPCSNVVMGVRKPTGELTWVSINSQPLLRGDAPPPYAVVASFADITERKKTEEALRESEQRFRTFVDHATDAFFLFDDRGVVLDVNRQACQSLGYTRDELLGMAPTDFDPDVTRARLEELRRKLDDGQLMAFESRHRRKDGTVFPVEVRGQAFWEAGRRFTVALARDNAQRKRAEEALRDSEQRWRSLTETLPHLVWTATPDGSCDYFSSQWTQHTGVAQSELLGWGWLVTLHPDDRERTRRVWLDSVAGRGPYDVEYRVRRHDGVHRWFKTRGVPIRDGGGNIVKWFGTCTDITDLRQTQEELRASEERFRGTFENAAVGISHTDLDGRFLRVNEKLCDILGYTREELLAKKVQDITCPEDWNTDRELFRRLVQGELPSLSRDKRYLQKDGSPIWVAVSVSLQRDAAGTPLNTISVARDISHRKRLEGELRQARDVAEAANRAKDEFLANVSHEIRTPMNAILGMTELVLDTALADDQRQCLRTAKSAADNLLGIINDLLDFAKIEAGKLELVVADFSLRAVVGDTLRALAVRAHTQRLELIYHVQPEVPDALVGDAGRLRQVLLNLVGNALKFTDEGEVIVRVGVEDDKVTRWQGDKVTEDSPHPVTLSPGHLVTLSFQVSDTGIGIPKDQQERIFRAFEQEDTSTTRRYGGTGLGLTIAARLVALMGGTITVDSEPGRGSTFAFTARLGLQPHPAEPTAAPPPVSVRNLPVLIVDDNAANRHILQEWLRDWEMEPEAVGDAAAAMDALWHRAANGRPYALVLLDARMPDRDGLAMAAMIRERAELSATRLILLTSGDRPGDPDRLRELRIDAHLRKPVQQEELLETIYRVMSRPAGSGPTTARPAPAQEGAAAPVPAAPPLHVLVAEDNEFSARLIDQLLTRRGHRVRLADNGRQALALAEEGVFDLLLLDIHLPGLDGFGIIEAIRARERAAGGHLPVIALTARSRKEDRERCLAAGMDDFLTKPVPSPALFAAIDRLVYAHRVSRPDPQDAGERKTLLDPVAVLASCGDDAEGLRRMCQDFQAYAPARLAEVDDALRERDAPRLRQAAHKFCALLFAFSTVAGNVASDLEDHAAEGRLGQAQPLVQRLAAMTQELLRLAGGLSLETLRQQAEATDDRKPAGQAGGR